MYTVKQVFDLAMDLINKRLPNGQVSPNTAQYRARALGLMTIWQTEMAITISVSMPEPIVSLSDALTINYPSCGAYFLAAHLLLVEDPDSAAFFEGKYQEEKSVIRRKQKTDWVKVENSYGF